MGGPTGVLCAGTGLFGRLGGAKERGLESGAGWWKEVGDIEYGCGDGAGREGELAFYVGLRFCRRRVHRGVLFIVHATCQCRVSPIC